MQPQLHCALAMLPDTSIYTKGLWLKALRQFRELRANRIEPCRNPTILTRITVWDIPRHYLHPVSQHSRREFFSEATQDCLVPVKKQVIK